MTPLREAWKKDNSLGSRTCRYGECKTGVVYEAIPDKSGRDARGRTRAYTATLAGVETFELVLGTLAHRCGNHAAKEVVTLGDGAAKEVVTLGDGAAKEVVTLGDGAAWIWNMFGRLFPGSSQILDFYHACDHLAHVAEARYGKDTEGGRQWQKARQAELKANGVSTVVAAINAWEPAREAHREIQRIESGYFRENAERMRYKTSLEKGYHIGSGVVEAACKHMVAQRLDQAGMHWRQETAEAIVTLRAAQLSTQPPDLRPYLAM